MPVDERRQAVSSLVRWILVVSLGCSLGLLTVYILVNSPLFREVASTPRAQSPSATTERSAKFSLSESATGEELTRVVRGQLTAFRNEDYLRAYELAADELRSQIPLPAFERMVKMRYPSIARSSSVKFGVIVDNGDEAIVNVAITGDGGGITNYQYFLQHQKSGWKVGGVVEVKPSGMVV